MMKMLGKYLDRKSLTLNVDKSKIMIFGKGTMKTKNQKWKWKEQELEIVKKFNYLAIVLQRNGNMIKHIEERARRAGIVLN